MPESDGPDHRFRLLREEIGALLREVRGGYNGLSARIGDCSVEITWTDAASAAGGPMAGVAGTDRSAVEPDRVEQPVDDATIVAKAPMVGTFYRAPEPGARPFVDVGDRVVTGQLVAIIEAMKLMNGIEAPRSGIVTELLVNDAECVEFDQPLMRIEPDEWHRPQAGALEAGGGHQP